MNIDAFVKSRHSRLSGIVVLYNVLKRNDSGQAGMTSKEGFSTSYETINIESRFISSILEVSMSDLVRFGVSIDGQLMKKYDSLIARKGYKNRSEAIRDLIRDRLVGEEWEGGDEDTVGTITLVYNHHTRELDHALTEMQHKSFHQIISALHVHLDAHNCLEVLVVKGKSRELRKIADRLIGARGVKHGKLTMTTTGKELV